MKCPHLVFGLTTLDFVWLCFDVGVHGCVWAVPTECVIECSHHFIVFFSSNKCSRDGSKDEVSAGKKLSSGLKSLPSVSLCKRRNFLRLFSELCLLQFHSEMDLSVDVL